MIYEYIIDIYLKVKNYLLFSSNVNYNGPTQIRTGDLLHVFPKYNKL